MFLLFSSLETSFLSNLLNEVSLKEGLGESEEKLSSQSKNGTRNINQKERSLCSKCSQKVKTVILNQTLNFYQMKSC